MNCKTSNINIYPLVLRIIVVVKRKHKTIEMSIKFYFSPLDANCSWFHVWAVGKAAIAR
jgi:hypothetical protein